MTTGQNIAALRKSRRPKLTQHGLADLLDIPRATLASWETGRSEPPPSVVARLSQLWGVPEDQLYDSGPRLESTGGAAPGGDPPAPYARRVTEGSGRRMFPLIGIAGAAAFPIDSVSEFPEDFVEFSDDLHIRGAEQFAVRVWGDSMEPRFEHGDYMLVTRDPNYRAPGRCVVVSDPDGRFVVKGLFRTEEGWELRPANLAYEVLPIDSPGWTMIGFASGWRRDRGRGSYIEEGDRTGLRFD